MLKLLEWMWNTSMKNMVEVKACSGTTVRLSFMCMIRITSVTLLGGERIAYIYYTIGNCCRRCVVVRHTLADAKL